MLLSIIQCSDYRRFSGKRSKNLKKKLSRDVEFVGPVLASNVSAMRNQGSSIAKGQWLFFMDEDCHVQVDRLLDLIMRIEKKSLPLVCVGGRYRKGQVNCLQKVYYRIQRQWVIQGLSGRVVNGFQLGSHLLGGALLVRKDIFKKAGGFNESIGWGGEEREFVGRLQEKGFMTAVSFSLSVLHTNNLNFFGFLKRSWCQNFNGAYYGLKKKSGNRSMEYLKTPWSFFLPTLLFFLLGFAALFFGKLTRFLFILLRFEIS